MRGTWLKHNQKKVTGAHLTALLRSTRGMLKYSSQMKKLPSTKYKKSRNQVDGKIAWRLSGWFIYLIKVLFINSPTFTLEIAVLLNILTEK